MKTSFTLLALLLFSCFTGNNIFAQTRAADSAALVTFYNTCGGASWTNKTNWLSAQPINTWYGITVANDRVKAIALSNNNLAGNIKTGLASVLANNSALQTIDLSRNALTDSFPAPGTATTGLVSVNVSYNQLTGSKTTFTSVASGITLNGNAASCSIVSGSTDVTVVNGTTASLTAGMYLSGNVGLTPYTTITSINSSTSFTVSKPMTATNAAVLFDFFAPANLYFANLATVNFSHNNIAGALPAVGALIFPGPNFKSFGAVPSLTNIDFSYNQFTTGGYNMMAGAQVGVSYNISHNNIAGSLPYMSNASLTSVDMSYNAFTGAPGFYAMGNLVSFKLDHNQLSATNLNMQIPASLTTLTLNNNRLSGTFTNPNASHLGLTNLQLDSNKYLFTLETVAALPNVIYTFQDTLLPLNFNTYVPGKLSVTAGGTLANNTYKWYNGTSLVATKTGDSTYLPVTIGVYTVKVTNSVATQLTITSLPFAITALPVKFLSFSVGLTSENTRSILKWQTATETGNSHFDIERSEDGKWFIKIGTVASLNGNSNQVNSYEFTDAIASVSKTIYYRLKQVDADGNFTYSNTVLLNNNRQFEDNIFITPNPVRNSVKVIINSNKAQEVAVMLIASNGAAYNISKKFLLMQGINNLPLELAGYTSGTYILKVINTGSNTVVGTGKMIKN